jgi:tRNA-dihydrouridine synthase A
MIEDILKPENNLLGCMIGRTAFENPWFFSTVDKIFYNVENTNYSRREVLLIYAKYC